LKAAVEASVLLLQIKLEQSIDAQSAAE